MIATQVRIGDKSVADFCLGCNCHVQVCSLSPVLIAICEDMIFGKPFSPLSLNVINGSLLTGSKKSLMREGEELDCGYTGVDFILRSRVGEDCSCCS